MSDNLFDYVNDIGYNKKYIFDENDDKYSNYFINKAFAQHVDTIMLASEMNKRAYLSNLMQHDFLFYSIDAKKRSGKWANGRDVNNDVIKYIQDRYSVSFDRSLEYIDMMSDEQLKIIENKLKYKKGKTK